MSHEYEILVAWSEEDQVFLAEAPELPGCAAHGDSQDAARAACKEAIGIWIDTAREAGRAIPPPRNDIHDSP